MQKYFTFGSSVTAACDGRMHHTVIQNLWKSFCLTDGNLHFTSGEDCTFRLGNTAMPTVPSDKEYAMRVDENGVAIVGKDHGGLVRGFMSLLMKIEYADDHFRVAVGEWNSNYIIKNRMIHICVFPENDLYFIQKLVRLAGLCQYTHIILEFWGMLQYDCLKELAWPHAFSKSEIKPLIDEIRALGMEPIPMFNQLGHATASRGCYGKHVVLDQNPRLQELFTPDGWAWNIRSPKVMTLLRKVRKELYDLFGAGEYMHIGCDEAHYYTRCDRERAALPQFLHSLTDDVVKEGRRPMLWMDMLLEQNKYPACYTTCKPEDVKPLTDALHPTTVMVDWQYDVKQAPVPTLLHLSNGSHDVIGAPWFTKENYTAHINTVKEHNLFGIMLTTWHTLKAQMPSILGCAKTCGSTSFTWSEHSGLHEETATLLRRVSFEGNTYVDSGWSKAQIEV